MYDENTVSMYPNPSTGIFTVSLNSSLTIKDEVRIEIFDMAGNNILLQSAPIINGQLNEIIQLDNNIPAGIYTVHVSTPEMHWVNKISLVK
jgi:hypothetical protein